MAQHQNPERHLNLEVLLESPSDVADLGWTLCFIGDSQETKLAELVRELKSDFSETGDGKQIVSGFSYWGIGPTIAWANTCADPFYPVMRQSILSFNSRWQQIYSGDILTQDFHYISLGVGTGEKDYHILTSLLAKQPNLFYFPVDMSSTMLRKAIQEVTKIEQLNSSQILPIQIDFYDERRVNNLRNLVDRIVPDRPILFSLLGNTLANFQDDARLLKNLSRLMRPEDRLLVEVATTKDLDDETVKAAANEYARIESFKKFVTSALLQNTDLHIELENLVFTASVEEHKAILIKVIYQNFMQETIQVRLPDWSFMNFANNDTIRLHLTRKYTSQGIRQMIWESGLSIINQTTNDFEDSNFGISLFLVSPDSTNLELIRIQELIDRLRNQGVTVDLAQDRVAKELADRASSDPTMRDKLTKWAQSLAEATVSDVVKGVVKLAIRLAGIPLP
jgi:uncharacterized SAM-dependent methyltransferase